MVPIARIAALAMALAATPASAQLYKWVDERGVTHYGDKPPANKGAPVTLRDATGGPKPEAAAKAKKPRNRETDLQRQEREFQERQERRDRDLADERSRRESASRPNASACRTARLDLDTMQRNPTNYSYAEQSEARDRIARYCR